MEANEGAQDGNEDRNRDGRGGDEDEDGGGDVWTNTGWERELERGRKREQ